MAEPPDALRTRRPSTWVTRIRKCVLLFVPSAATGKAIGSIGVEEHGNEEKLTEFANYKGRSIGYVLNKAYWGIGLMSEAVHAVAQHLFDTLDYDFLLSGHFDFNDASRRVQEKCGFLLYRKLDFETHMEKKEPGALMLLKNPKKDIHFAFSCPEALLIDEKITVPRTVFDIFIDSLIPRDTMYIAKGGIAWMLN